MITDHLAGLVREALDRAISEGAVPTNGSAVVEFERPRRAEHGDWTTNVALSAAGGNVPPRAVAEAVVARLPHSDVIGRVDIAGPGFINFELAPQYFHDVVKRAARTGSGFGRSDVGAGKTVNVEYVSANPTGPISVVSGRHAAVGDAIARLLEATGYRVTREFYLNDAGRQISLFGASVGARYLQSFGRDAQVPDDGYQGDYVKDIAAQIREQVADRYVDAQEDDRNAALAELGLELMVANMKESLARFGTEFDVWFSERSLWGEPMEDAIEELDRRGFIEDKEGARWFLSSRLGDDKDRVIVRSDGRPTYLAPDVAYMADKFARGFDRLIYLLGADHHGTVARFLAAAEALGFGKSKVEIRILQVVRLTLGGQASKGSKRAGVIVTLDELVREVGKDAARYTFLTRSIDAPLTFDIELAKQQAPENPVYYVQYAHARICSILGRAREEGRDLDIETAPLHVLTHEQESALMRKLAAYEDMVPDAAELRAPQKVCAFIEELASVFSAFYRDCRVISEDDDATRARLALSVATKNVIADGLGLLGVDAPERM
ncbi:MAG: arginine--tRNA ligase [Actinomycetota bacterium]|nr:arginine--tRNA ligase [Actinomycetota bacterium]